MGAVLVVDVFISFKTSDTDRVRPFHDGFRARGLAVFWSNDIATGSSDYQAIIRAKIREATTVLVIWTHSSVESNAVAQECSQAERDLKLIQVMLDDIAPIDLPFEARFKSQKAMLIGWVGDTSDPGWTKLNDAIDARSAHEQTARGINEGSFDARVLDAERLFVARDFRLAKESRAIPKPGDAIYDNWQSTSAAEQLEFLDMMERGWIPKDPWKAAQAPRFRAMLFKASQDEMAYGSAIAFVDYYILQLWKQRVGAELFNKVQPDRGERWHQNVRTIDFIKVGLRSGLELKSTNPETLLAMRLFA